MKLSKTPKEKHIKVKDIPIRVKIFMISDSLSSVSEEKRAKLDLSSRIAEDLIHQYGYHFLGVEYIPDEKNAIRQNINSTLEHDVQLIITIGGTGIAKRDITIDAIRPLLDKELPGFGELFRHLTYEEVGTVSIMTRAIAGVKNETVLVCLPGSPNAIKLGIPLIFQEILHLINLLTNA
ncbi:MAG: MogA/MoaB family molybdenum cofactor biosynthesis protein [Candidatus Helarchaeota archaeon]